MKTSDTNDLLPTVTARLERMLVVARGEKTLAQVPALRRLRTVVRTFLILGLLAQITVIPAGLSLHVIHNTVDQAGLGVSSSIAFILYSAVVCISLAAGWLLLCVYARFMRQFRKNDVNGIKDTTEMILRIFRYSLLLLTLTLVLLIAMLRNPVDSAMLLLPSLLMLIVMYLIGRHYIHTAHAELPALAAAVADDLPPENYRTWRLLFSKLLVIAVIVVGLGYIVGGLLNLKNTSPGGPGVTASSAIMNAMLPMQVDSETRWDSITAGPDNRMTFLYTLVNLSAGDLDEVKFSEKMRQILVADYKTNPNMAAFRKKGVEVHYTYRFKDGNTAARIVVSPKDL